MALSIDKSQIDSSAYFDKRDSTVFIVNHPNNVDFKNDNIRTIDVNKDLFQSIKKDIPENCSVFLSQSRGLIIFEKSGNWNKASIKELFIDGKFKIEFTELRHFKYGPFLGFYSKNKLILHTKEITPKNVVTVSLLIKKPIIVKLHLIVKSLKQGIFISLEIKQYLIIGYQQSPQIMRMSMTKMYLVTLFLMILILTHFMQKNFLQTKTIHLEKAHCTH